MDSTVIDHMGPASAVVTHDPMSQSWVRSAHSFRIDPAAHQAPTILTDGELRTPRERLERLRHVARPEIDHLYSIIAPLRYVVLLTDENGIVVEHRGEEMEAGFFKSWGVWLGGVWAEEVEGTNGIGTCLIERRPVTVHGKQHFRHRHQTLSCSGAPLFDADDRLIGVLDISCCNPELSERAHALAQPLVVSVAAAIDERMFRERFRREWIISSFDGPSSGLLFAVDAEHRIVGANHAGRRRLQHARLAIEAEPSLWSLYLRNESALRDRSSGDRRVALVDAVEGEPRSAIVTPPASRREASLDLRPRLGELNSFEPPPAAAALGGGLSPAAMARVAAFIDAHLHEHIDLVMLAGAAGLSHYHFARAFKKSAGQTPHDFVLSRRLAKAQSLLQTPEVSLAEIAVAAGFADQSHLTRRFRDAFGVTPRQFRQSRAG